VEHFFSHFKDLGPWAASVVGAVLIKIGHTLTKEIRSLKETQVKADLAYEEVSERVPTVKARYETWAAHR
jgi:hypothetical protein